MKKTFLFFAVLFAAVISFTLTSCDGKEAGDVLTGTWVDNPNAKQEGGKYTAITFDGKDKYTCESIIYAGNGAVHAGWVKMHGTYVIEKETFTIRYRYESSPENEYVEKYEFSIDGKILYIRLIESDGYPVDGMKMAYTKQ